MLTEMESFAEDVKNAFELRYPGEKVEIRKVTKNNGVIYTGITVSGEGEHVFPTLYLEPFAEETEDDGITEELIERMCKIYENRRLGNTVSLDHLRYYSAVKDRIRCKLINFDSNKERLENIPHRRFLDLAIVPYCRVNDNDLNFRLSGEASFIVTSGNLNLWGVSAEEVIDDGIANTLSGEHLTITGMYDILKRLNPSLAETAGDEIKSCPMYVMTIEGGNGAVSMIFEDRLKEFCESINSDVYVIPSSINEIILVPYVTDTPESMLNEMIREINDTQLDAVDVLSDHAYLFTRESGYMCKAT